jgi:hypothetical protein
MAGDSSQGAWGQVTNDAPESQQVHMKTNIERRCRECGIGKIRPVAKSGRRERYRTMELEIPEDIKIPTCDNCGAEWMDRAVAKAIDQALEAEYRMRMRMTLNKVLEIVTAHASMRQVERLIGLSEGYLSKVKQGRSEPSPELLSSLGLLALDPGGGLQGLDRLWTEAQKKAPHAKTYAAPKGLEKR